MAENGCESKAQRYGKVYAGRPCNRVDRGDVGHRSNLYVACDIDFEWESRVGGHGLQRNRGAASVLLPGCRDLLQAGGAAKNNGMRIVGRDLPVYAFACSAAAFWRKA